MSKTQEQLKKTEDQKIEVVQYYVGSLSAIQQAIDVINKNCGWPDGKGTDTWGTPVPAIYDLYRIPYPRSTGYRNQYKSFTRAEMIKGVGNINNISIQNKDPKWSQSSIVTVGSTRQVTDNKTKLDVKETDKRGMPPVKTKLDVKETDKSQDTMDVRGMPPLKPPNVTTSSSK
jgi:hypothetical protein